MRTHRNASAPDKGNSYSRERAREVLLSKVAHENARGDDRNWNVLVDAERRLRWIDCAPEGARHQVAPLQDKRGVPCGHAWSENVGPCVALREARAARGLDPLTGSRAARRAEAATHEPRDVTALSGGVYVSYREIRREDMPSDSFVYGQRAAIDGVDAPAESWIVCTDCAHEDEDGSFRTVLVGHFLHSTEDGARDTAAGLARSHSVTLVRPSEAVAS